MFICMIKKYCTKKEKFLLLRYNAVVSARRRLVWYQLPSGATERPARGSMTKGMLPLSQPNCYPLPKADGWHEKMKNGTKT